jgi:hypothetical protein
MNTCKSLVSMIPEEGFSLSVIALIGMKDRHMRRMYGLKDTTSVGYGCCFG